MSYKTTIVRELSRCIQARLNYQKSGNEEWHCRHSDTIHQLEKLLLEEIEFDEQFGRWELSRWLERKRRTAAESASV